MARIGIIGDFNPEYRSYHATNAALEHAAAKLGCTVEITWVPTPSLVEPHAVEILASYEGLWASPGSPYRSMKDCWPVFNSPATATGRLSPLEAAFNMLC